MFQVDIEAPNNTLEWKSIEEWLHLDMNPLTGKVSTFAWGPELMNSKSRYPHDSQFQMLLTVIILFSKFKAFSH